MPELPVSIVTGAGSGIGLAVSQQLSQMGHHVVLVGRREGVLKEAAAALAGPCAHPGRLADAGSDCGGIG